MSAKRPSKLSDIFNMTNTVTRGRQDGTSSRLGRTLDIDGITSRYQRNKVLVDPKAFHLMSEYDTLRKFKVFAVYKPPFAPMRRKESYDNHHRVSVESYISAALKSRDMEAVVSVLKRGEDPNAQYRAPTNFDPSRPSSSSSSSTANHSNQLQIRVVNDLTLEAAGPILVHLADPTLYVHNDFTRYHFEAIVYGHVQLRSAAATEEAIGLMRGADALYGHGGAHHNSASSMRLIGVGGFGTIPSEMSSIGASPLSSSGSGTVAAAGIDGRIREGFAGTSAAIGNTVEMDNLSLLYPSLAETEEGAVNPDGEKSPLNNDDTTHRHTKMMDLPRQRMTAVPRRSLSPSVLKAAVTYLEEHQPALAVKAAEDLKDSEQMEKQYAVMLQTYDQEMEAFKVADAAYRAKHGGDENLSAAFGAKRPVASAGIMPPPGEKTVAPTPSQLLQMEMDGKPEKPSMPPPPPQPMIAVPAPPRIDAPMLRVAIRSFGFYATHPVTLIRFSVQSPSTAAAPDVARFVRACTGSYIVGDPMAKKDVNNPFVKTLRAGDKDFARVLVNLRSLGVNVFQRNPLWGDEQLLRNAATTPNFLQRKNDLALAANPWLSHPKYLEFACDGSLDTLVSDTQLTMKKARICLTDGYWSPTMRAGV